MKGIYSMQDKELVERVIAQARELVVFKKQRLVKY